MASILRWTLLLTAGVLLLQAVDFALTWVLLDGGWRSDIYEANPVANAILSQHGWGGLAAFKAFCALVALGAVSLAARRSPRLALRLAVLQCAVMIAVVCYSGTLLASPSNEPPLAILEQSSDRLEDRRNAMILFQRARTDLCKRLLSGEQSFVSSVDGMRDCVAQFAPLLIVPHRTRLPNLEQPGQVAAYLYHHCSRLTAQLPGGAAALKRIGTEMGNRFPDAPQVTNVSREEINVWATKVAQAG